MIRPTAKLLVFLFLSSSIQSQSFAQKANSDEASGREQGLTSLLCGKDLVLLGEASHGDGATFSFKSRLILNLIQQCGFGLILFEAPTYDYLASDEASDALLAKRRVTSDRDVPDRRLLRAAPLWSWTKEFYDLQQDLASLGKSQRVVQGGLDDQINGGTWAIENLPKRMGRFLEDGDCNSAIEKFILAGGYWSENPYSKKVAAFLVGCLDNVIERINSMDATAHRWNLEMALSLRRLAEREPTADETYLWSHRDESMFLNFLLWQNRVPGVKTIVWAHNVHIAKYNLDSDEKPFGTWVRAMLGNQSFALGISARSGSYRNGGPDGDLVYLPLPPEDAIEGLISCRGIQKLDAGSFLPSQCLKATHSHSSRLLGRSFEHRDWYQLYDGVVVLETQHPPTLHSQ